MHLVFLKQHHGNKDSNGQTFLTIINRETLMSSQFHWKKKSVSFANPPNLTLGESSIKRFFIIIIICVFFFIIYIQPTFQKINNKHSGGGSGGRKT